MATVRHLSDSRTVLVKQRRSSYNPRPSNIRVRVVTYEDTGQPYKTSLEPMGKRPTGLFSLALDTGNYVAHKATIASWLNGRMIYVYKKSVFLVNSTGQPGKEIKLLVKDAYFKRQRKLSRLAKQAEAEEAFEQRPSSEARREHIPDDVRSLVWRRDGGQCVRCGAKEELQFDHIIPVSKGGGNSDQNLQILCGRCNREKSDHI